MTNKKKSETDDVFLSGRIQIMNEKQTLSQFINERKHGPCSFKKFTIQDLQKLTSGDIIILKNDKYLIDNLIKKRKLSPNPKDKEFLLDYIGQQLTIISSDDDDVLPLEVGKIQEESGMLLYSAWIPIDLVQEVIFIIKRKKL